MGLVTTVREFFKGEQLPSQERIVSLPREEIAALISGVEHHPVIQQLYPKEKLPRRVREGLEAALTRGAGRVTEYGVALQEPVILQDHVKEAAKNYSPWRSRRLILGVVEGPKVYQPGSSFREPLAASLAASPGVREALSKAPTPHALLGKLETRGFRSDWGGVREGVYHRYLLIPPGRSGEGEASRPLREWEEKTLTFHPHTLGEELACLLRSIAGLALGGRLVHR